MIRSLAIVSLFAGAALSQSVVPSGISDKCTAYLKALNEDTTMTPCTSALIAATSAYAPGSNSTASASSISSTLGKLCAGTACPQSLIRSQLAKFTMECNEELTSKVNNDVVRLYDTLYLLTPVKNVLCTKDEEGEWCLNSIKQNVDNIADVEKNLSSQSNQVPIPNSKTFCSSNLVFAFLKPTLSSDKLCKSCTRQILQSYIAFESDTAYAPGLSQSALLCGQTDLYNGIVSTCGQDFLSGAVQAAGGISSGLGNGPSSAASHLALDFSSAAAILVGAMALALN